MSADLNVKPYNNRQLLLFPASIGDYLAEDDLAHIVDEAVEEINLIPYYQKISAVGNPSYHPALMIKLWFYGYATKTYSSRKIEEKLHKDVAFIYLAGMQKPDFKAISEFRRKNLSELKDSFLDILQICHRLGLTKLGGISIDSKVMKANASISRTYGEKKLAREREEIAAAIQQYLNKAGQTDTEEDQKYGPDMRGNELPRDIRNKQARIKKMRQIKEELKQIQEELKGKNSINLTDKDAGTQRDKSRKIAGYRAQVAVDSKQQIILANDVTSKTADTQELIPMTDRVIENVKKLKSIETQEDSKPEKIKLIADSGYGSGENLAELDKREEIDAYIPDMRYQGKQRGHKTDEGYEFHSSNFIYNREDNYCICPEGKTLNFMKVLQHNNKEYLLYKCSDCKSCRHFKICANSRKSKYIWISKDRRFVERMRQKLSTEEGAKTYGLRKTTVEPVLGNLSQNLGFREFLLRGLEKVKGEYSLMCTAHNILKIAKFLRQQGVGLKACLSMQELLAVADTS
jgi:transposase